MDKSVKVITITKIFLLLLITSACSSSPIKSFVSEGHPLSPIRKAIVLTQPGLYPDIIDAVKNDLTTRGIEIVEMKNFTSESQLKTDKADSVIWVDGAKAWDVSFYIRRMEVRVYDSKSGLLLGTGKWETRWWHGFLRTEEVVQDLINMVLERTQSPLN